MVDGLGVVVVVLRSLMFGVGGEFVVVCFGCEVLFGIFLFVCDFV